MTGGGYTIEVRLAGRDLPPTGINARDAAALIAAVEGMLAAVVARQMRSELNEADVVISLAELRPSGYALVFSTPKPGVVETAFAAVINCIDTERFELLPSRAVEGIREVRRITRKYGVEVEFAGRDGGKKTAHKASIRPTTHIETEPAGIRGTETLYGMVIRVGGEEPARARLRLLSGGVITCDITRRKSWMIARELGARLYQIVGVRGEARYNIADHALLHFRIDHVLPYSETSIDRALTALSEVVGSEFAQNCEIGALVKARREGDD